MFQILSTTFLHFIFIFPHHNFVDALLHQCSNERQGYHWVVNLNRRQRGGGNAVPWLA